jgi:hypothetical protein
MDTLMFWETGPSGWRAADTWLRTRYAAIMKSVVAPNSLYGAMAIQGMAMAISLHRRWPDIALNESHPKVLYHALCRKKYRWDPEMIMWLDRETQCSTAKIANEHEWDALISAWATRKGLLREWTNDLRSLSSNAIEPAGSVTYWWPES